MRPTTVWLNSLPYSMDPADFDAFVHHVTSQPCFSPLITQYKAGTIQGVIAESWGNSADLKEWSFTIRKGLHFSNGDEITPAIVLASLTRMAWLQHKAASHAGWTEHLVGVDSLTSASGKFDGLSADGQVVKFRFKDPQPKLLETVSFGLYSIVNPADFDPATGKWHDPHTAVSSGPYVLKAWGSDSLRLALRPDFPESLRHPQAPAEVELSWNADQRANSDLVMGSSLEDAPRQDDEFYAPGAANVSILYMETYSWNHPDSPFKDKQFRLKTRDAFYKALGASGRKVTRSFLPTTVPGVHEFSDPAVVRQVVKPKNPVRAVDAGGEGIRLVVSSAAKAAVQQVGADFQPTPKLTQQEFGRHLNADEPHYSIDVGLAGTGILLEDPEADVKFMILSKEGIRLPDPTGRLHVEARKEHLDLAAINQILWDDAVVWPITHYTAGLYARHGLFDFSQINLDLPPTDLSWIGVGK